ncbi:MAG: 4Fe-4S binding protein [Promethearchaeota archaeon]
MNIKDLRSKIKNHQTTIARRLVQIIAFILINYIILELIFTINLLSFEPLIKVLPIINAPGNSLSNGAGILEYIFGFLTVGRFSIFLIGILMLVILFTNRIFCGWICPIGTIQDGCAAIPTKKRTVKESGGFLGLFNHKSLLKIKYLFVIIIIIIVLPLGITYTANKSFYLEYKANLGELGVNPMGYFSLAEYIFVFFPNIIKEMFKTGSLQPLFSDALTFIIFFFYLIVIVLSVWYPRVYCRYLCPFGATAAAISRYSFLKLSRNPVKCVGRSECGICEKVCPKQIRMLDEHFEFFTGKGECNFCMKCKEECPYDAIEVKFG